MPFIPDFNRIIFGDPRTPAAHRAKLKGIWLRLIFVLRIGRDGSVRVGLASAADRFGETNMFQSTSQKEIKKFKREASRLKKESGGNLTHMQALETLARRKGFSGWYEYEKSFLKPQLVFVLERDKLFNRELSRLQKDGTWRLLENPLCLEAGDYNTTIPDQILNERGKYEDTLSGKMESRSSADIIAMFHYDYRVLGSEPPPIPEVSQLRKVIASGDDQFLNVLILKIDGKFDIFDYHGDKYRDEWPEYVCRHESTDPGNDYVGPEAANDDEFVELMFASSLGYWLSYVCDGLVGYFRDNPANESSEALLLKINQTLKMWKSRL